MVKILDLYIADKNRLRKFILIKKKKIFVKDICEISRYAFPKLKLSIKIIKRKIFYIKEFNKKYKIIRNLKNDLINFFLNMHKKIKIFSASDKEENF